MTPAQPPQSQPLQYAQPGQPMMGAPQPGLAQYAPAGPQPGAQPTGYMPPNQYAPVPVSQEQPAHSVAMSQPPAPQPQMAPMQAVGPQPPPVAPQGYAPAPVQLNQSLL